MSKRIDIGHNHTIRFFGWKPDRSVNPQYADIPDIEKCGIIITHPNLKGEGECESGINFDTEETRKVFKNEAHRWQVLSYEPLTINPSIMCLRCGDHGFIREGKWIPA